MWSDRVERIVACMEFLEWVRSQWPANRLNPDRGAAMINQVGELDQLSELHRLIWEWETPEQVYKVAL
jgi:hypothetical protein